MMESFLHSDPPGNGGVKMKLQHFSWKGPYPSTCGGLVKPRGRGKFKRIFWKVLVKVGIDLVSFPSRRHLLEVTFFEKLHQKAQ